MTGRPLRLVIADDEPLVRGGLRMLLDAEPDLSVVADAADGHEAVRAAAAHRPDLVLMDVRMPVVDGILATRRIVAGIPDPPRILVLTTFANDDYLYGALRAGAGGFVLKRARPAEIAAAVRTVAAGGSLVLPESSRLLLAEHGRRAEAGRARWAAALARLSPREREVLGLLADGMTNAEIADHLFLGVQTVKSHVAAVLAKLGARDRTQAVVIAYESGFRT